MIITAVLNQNPDLFYYQGYHDVVSVFLLTLGENLGYHCANIASKYLIKDFMLETFEMGVFPALDLTSKLIQLVDMDLWNLIEQSGGQPNFALSWILTWFSHDIDNLEKVQLVFDACLATHPLFNCYITVAQIVMSKNAILGDDINEDFDPDFAEHPPEIKAFIVFKDMRDNQKFQIEEAIKLANTFYEKYSPEHVNKLIQDEQRQEQEAAKKATPGNHQIQRQRHLFSANSPCLRYEMERMYLSNKKLIVYEDSIIPELTGRVQFGLTVLSVLGVALLSYQVMLRAQ